MLASVLEAGRRIATAEIATQNFAAAIAISTTRTHQRPTADQVPAP